MRPYSNPYQIQKPVSIHASVKDATKQARKFKDGFSGFNPRICKRCDLGIGSLKSPPLVSIHASVKDATNDAGVLSDGNLFQSTHL